MFVGIGISLNKITTNLSCIHVISFNASTRKKISAPAHGGPDKEEEIPSSQPREMRKEEKNTRSGPGVLRRGIREGKCMFHDHHHSVFANT